MVNMFSTTHLQCILELCYNKLRNTNIRLSEGRTNVTYGVSLFRHP